jgi:hypothetical protein
VFVLRPIIYFLNRIANGLLNYADRNVDRAARRQGWTDEQTQAFRDHIQDIRDNMDEPCDHCGGIH